MRRRRRLAAGHSRASHALYVKKKRLAGDVVAMESHNLGYADADDNNDVERDEEEES